MPSAAILTIGNELVSGDVANTNAQWLARRLEQLGVSIRLIAAVPDDVDEIAGFVQREAPAVDVLLVTGGLGGTHDDVTREAIAAAFGVEQPLVAELAELLRARFPGDPEYAAQWARLPSGSRPLENPLGGAPGFLLENVFVLPGLPSEMEAMFETIADELGGFPPIGSWRRRYRTRESIIAPVLVEASERFPGVIIGSYPSFHSDGPDVEVVVKSSDSSALNAASDWIDVALTRVLRRG